MVAAGFLVAGCAGDDPADEGAEEEQTGTSGYGGSAPDRTDDAEDEEPDEAEEDEDAEDEAEGDDPADGEEVQLTIAGHDFDVPETVAPGAEITVTNDDAEAHTVTSDEEGHFDVEVPPGETVTFTAPDEPGDYDFHCIPHPVMTATLTVE